MVIQATTSIMLNLAELEARGWANVEGVVSGEDLLQIGRALGSPVPSPNGEMVKQIRVTPKSQAPQGSQSSLYGTGPFPLHTDTVFWPRPARYVILRATGDTRRPTTVMSFSRLVQLCGSGFADIAEQSIWLVGKASAMLKKFYCSLRFRDGQSYGWRYDADCMSPANAAAVRADAILRPLVIGEHAECIAWSNGGAVVLSNWRVLHGRGPEPPGEGVRMIERLYVT
jgi:hypothetical protein